MFSLAFMMLWKLVNCSNDQRQICSLFPSEQPALLRNCSVVKFTIDEKVSDIDLVSLNVDSHDWESYFDIERADYGKSP